MSESEIENEIREKGLTAARITPDDVDGAIALDQYHRFPGTTTTVCCLTLANGFNVIGEAAAASPENFDEDIGKKVAFEDARGKIWQLLGFQLRTELHCESLLDELAGD